jgi:single-strand DNA-binding protein
MNRITLTGGITKDPSFRQTQSGQSVLGFDVANTQGYGDKEHTEYYQVSIWGKSAEGLNGKLSKGCRVVVSGEHRIEKREHNGKEYNNNKINFADVEVVKWADNAGQQQPTQQQSKPEFDDDIPF